VVLLVGAAGVWAGTGKSIDQTVDISKAVDWGAISTYAGLQPAGGMGISPAVIPTKYYFPSDSSNPCFLEKAWMVQGKHIATFWGPAYSSPRSPPIVLIPDRNKDLCTLYVSIPFTSKIDQASDTNVIKIVNGKTVVIPIDSPIETFVLLACGDGVAPVDTNLPLRLIFKYANQTADTARTDSIHPGARITPVPMGFKYGNEVFTCGPMYVDGDSVQCDFSETWHWYAFYPKNKVKVDSIVLVGVQGNDPRSIYIPALSYSKATLTPTYDFGDAPDPTYPSLLANDGARHTNSDGIFEWLGDVSRFKTVQQCEPNSPQVDMEQDSYQIDQDSPNNPPGPDDGIEVYPPYGGGGAVESLDVLVGTSGMAGRYAADKLLNLHAWFDFNMDGDWGDTNEALVWLSATAIGPTGTGTAEPVNGTASYAMNPAAWNSTCRLYRFTFKSYAGTIADNCWARFRLDYNQNINTVTGEATHGEVEDHAVWIDSTSIGIKEKIPNPTPSYFEIRPNPAKNLIGIRYNVTRAERVNLAIYSSDGVRIKTLVNSHQTPGDYVVYWDGQNQSGKKAAAGLYFYRLKVGEKAVTQKMIIIR